MGETEAAALGLKLAVSGENDLCQTVSDELPLYIKLKNASGQVHIDGGDSLIKLLQTVFSSHTLLSEALLKVTK